MSNSHNTAEPKIFRAIDRLSEFGGYVSGICLFIAALVVCHAVVWRALGKSADWQTELSVYLLILVTFVGGAYGLKHDAHVSVDILYNKLPNRARHVQQILVGAISLILILVVAWRTSEMWLEAYEEGWGSGTAWNPKLIYPYAIIPLGMIMLALQYVVHILRRGLLLVRNQTVHNPTGDDVQ